MVMRSPFNQEIDIVVLEYLCRHYDCIVSDRTRGEVLDVGPGMMGKEELCLRSIALEENV